jgi:hypothetical protein
MMGNKIILKDEMARGGRSNVYILAAFFLILSTAAGCGIKRVSILNSQPTRTPIKADDVRFYADGKQIKGNWRAVGMISAYLNSKLENTAKNRQALITETVSRQGANAVIGLQNNIGEGIYRPGHSNGILAVVSSANPPDAAPAPKFIVCLPPVNFKIEKNASMNKLDSFIREHIQYYFGYQKGYYVYRFDAPGVSGAAILRGEIDAEVLGEPLGVAPDYALLCDVDCYEQKDNIIIQRSQILEITMTLYDVKRKKIVWLTTTAGESRKNVLTDVALGVVTGSMFNDDDFWTALQAVKKATNFLPAIPGFQCGPIDPLE